MPLLLTGCLGTKHLKDDEKLLVRQTTRVSRKVDQEELRSLYVQRPNRRFLGVPSFHLLVTMYYAGLKRYNKEKFVRKKEQAEKKFDAKIAKTTNQKKINNLQFRKQKKIDKFNSRIENGNQFMQWGEPVAVFDSVLVKTTLDRFSNYLFSKGYFTNSVTTRINTIGKLVTINYRIETGPPFIIDSIIYRIQDTTVNRIVSNNKSESLLKKSERYEESNLSKERERLDLLLKDNGFFDFSRQYIDFEVDTSALKNNKVLVILFIRNPAKRGYHKQFEIDSIRFTTDAGVPYPGYSRKTRTYRDVQYRYFENNYNLKILSQRLFLTPASLYSRSNTYNSQRQLANLDAFKFVNINYDTSGGRFIANIFTSPLDRYEWSNEVGLNITQGYPGPFYNITFKKRNIFRGLENFEFSGRIGVEGVAGATGDQIYRSTEAGVNASLLFPQFLWPFRGGTQIRLGKYNPKTRLSVGYSFSERPEYRRTSTTLSNTYTWQNKRSTQYSLALTNISLINSTIKDDTFNTLLNRLYEQGNYNLKRSFEPSFVSSMIFGITWSKDYGTYDKNAFFLRGQVESGGTTLNFIDPAIITDQGLQYFKYLRFSLDFRKLKILNKWATLAYRVNTGYAWSYGSGNSLPYEKFYFVGGSNSVRAWRPRRLGLGSVPPPLNENPQQKGLFNYQFEQPGEILLEGSVELRSKLFGFVHGAVFIDAGNVWSSQRTISDPNTPAKGSSQFRVDSFYRELGIGTGFGLRFDFTFLIFRLDVGIKAYDPAREPGDRFVLDKFRFWKPYANTNSDGTMRGPVKEPVIYNFNIGYPF
ncbi:BamA/TamA family outer membrane protein [Chryseosolibacter indicus]|uniref:BamA/TamA family outer membrane protein n=1 Tax=Chryseosolibacter indicus TaxID=2782351 RepID=A0ABS5VPT5_9BACT|nr:BamA/TamA family outer membrane protein [Chryseosolibacter indicus]MBT1703428.1 BamA/TamA family outer membrane protein [Chryseosolibacter indicus]